MPAWIATALAATAGLLVALSAEASPRTQTFRDDGAARIVVYDSLCDEDNSVECLTVEIGCGAPGEFNASLYNLDAGEAASVFARGKEAGGKGYGSGKASLTVGAETFGLQVSKVALSEHSYNFDVTALSLEQGRPIWAALWNAGELRLQAGTRKAAIRRAEVGDTPWREVVSACGAASP